MADSLSYTPPTPIRAGSTGSTLFVTVNQLRGGGNNIFKKIGGKSQPLFVFIMLCVLTYVFAYKCLFIEKTVSLCSTAELLQQTML